MPAQKRRLGRSGIEVTALGLGCMRLSSKGWYSSDGKEIDFGPVDDKESIRIINLAIDAGVHVFDTAVIYGAGHNEKLLGQAVAGKRDSVVIVSKAGQYIDEEKRTLTGKTIIDKPQDVKKLCEGSLRRLNTDYIDIYLLHTFFKNDKVDLEKAAEIRDMPAGLCVSSVLPGSDTCSPGSTASGRQGGIKIYELIVSPRFWYYQHMESMLNKELLNLSVSERIRLVEDIWDSIREVQEAVELTEEEKE